MMREPTTVVLPAAGVIPTRPATAPVAPPTAVAFLVTIHSMRSHAITAAAVAIWVVNAAKPAEALAAAALPALKPNQPTQSREAPITVKGTLWGCSAGVP